MSRQRHALVGRESETGTPGFAVAHASDLATDGSLWALWPTLREAIETDAIVPGEPLGSVTIADGTVTAWDVLEPFRSERYPDIHDSDPMPQTIDLPFSYRLFNQDQTHSAIVVDQDADTVATPDGESLRGTGIALTFPDVGPANAPIGMLETFMPSSLPGTSAPPERESSDSGTDDGSDESEDTTEVPQPPDEHCNGESSDGTLCGLSAGWGRADDATENPGRCKYHKDQAIQTSSDGGTPIEETAYGEGGYGGTESA